MERNEPTYEEGQDGRLEEEEEESVGLAMGYALRRKLGSGTIITARGLDYLTPS